MAIFDKDEWIISKFTSGLYEVTTDGTIISYNNRKGKIRSVGLTMKTVVHPKTGYVLIGMWDKDLKKGITCLVHRVVALIHLPNPLKYSSVNHVDGNKQRNDVNNLEWCSSSQNIKHAYDTGLKSATGIKNGAAKLNDIQVKEIREMRDGGMLYKEIAPLFGIHPMTVGEICRREIWSHVL